MAYSTISKPGVHFNTKLYTGNGSNDSAQTGVGFKPDWLWIKARNQTYDHMLFDRVRQGSDSQPYDMRSNNTNAQSSDTTNVKSFDTDGFTLNNGGYINGNSVPFVSWNWKAANSAGVANNNGTIQSTVSANDAAGFSIIKWTGSGSTGTVGHGLSATPVLTIRKVYSGTGDWFVHTTLIDGSLDFLKLNTTAAKSNSSLSGFTSTTVGVTNNTSNTVLYAFTPIKGYSAFGVYQGTGNTDGPFIYTGFKPAFVLTKVTSTTDGWSLTDSVRDKAVTPNGARLLAQDTQTEQTNETWALIEKYSNGFKLRGTDNVTNANGQTYLYLAFAAEPFVANVGSKGIPTTASNTR